MSRGAKSGLTVGSQRAGRVNAACVSQGAGYSALFEPLFGTATGQGSSSQPPADLMTFRAHKSPLSDPGAADQPPLCASLLAASPTVVGRHVPGPKSSVSPPFQHLDPDQVEVRTVDLQNGHCRT